MCPKLTDHEIWYEVSPFRSKSTGQTSSETYLPDIKVNDTEHTELTVMTSNNKLRQYSFQHLDKTLQKILSIGEAFGSIKIQTKKIAKSTENSKLEEDINAVRKQTPSLGKNNSSFKGE